MTLLRSPIHSPIRSPIYNPRVGKWGGPYDASLFGPSSAGFLYGFSNTGLLFQNSNGTTPVTADNDPIGWAKSTVASQRIATQATTSARPFWKTPNFSRFDGSDDNWLTTFNPTAAGSLAFRGKINSTAKVIIGADGGSNTRCYIGIGDGSTLGAGVGAQSYNVITGGPNIVGVLGTGCLTYDVSTVKLYWNGSPIYSFAQSGSPTLTTPHRVGALNSLGTAVNFAPADLYNALAINRDLTPAEVLNLSNYWNAQ